MTGQLVAAATANGGGLTTLIDFLDGPVLIVIILWKALKILLQSNEHNHALKGAAVIVIGLGVVGLIHGENANNFGAFIDSFLPH